MIYNLQALRAVAAFLVIFVHIVPLFDQLPGGRPELRFAHSGVDLFFIISGFIMVHATAAKPTRPIAFMLDRVIRIAPLYWGMTLLYFLLGLFLSSSFPGLRASTGDLLRSLLFIPYSHDAGPPMPLLYVGWTLNYEMFFYLLFAGGLLLASVTTRAVAVGAVLVGLVAAGRAAAGVPASSPLAFYTDPILLEFVLGMALGWLHTRGRHLPLPLAWVALIGGLVVLVTAPFLITAHRAIVSGVPAAAVVAGALALEARGRVVRAGFVQLLGGASYALYLIHPLVASIVVKVAKVVGATATLPGMLVFALLFVVLAEVGAIIVHLVVERPVGAWLRHAVGHRRSRVDREEDRALPA